MGRGGVRPNSGRPRVDGRKINFICPTDLANWLDSIKGNITKTDAIINALYEYKRYHKAGN